MDGARNNGRVSARIGIFLIHVREYVQWNFTAHKRVHALVRPTYTYTVSPHYWIHNLGFFDLWFGTPEPLVWQLIFPGIFHTKLSRYR